MSNGKSAVLAELRIASVDEAKAVAFLEKQRWGDDPYCPHCGEAGCVYPMTSGEHRNKDYRWRCNGCKKMYTVRTKTVLEETRLPLRVWVYAIWEAASSKKGLAALELSREMEITHKSALFVLRRLRYGLEETDPKLFTGTVEADEVYIGGRPRYFSHDNRGRYRDSKTPVAGIVQRGGDVRFRVMDLLTRVP